MTDLLDQVAPASPPEPPKSWLWHRLYHDETKFDFVRNRWWGFGLSGLVILVSLVSLGLQGLNMGIDFEGGISWEVPGTNGFSTSDAESVLSANGIDPRDAKIQTLATPGGEE